MKNQIKAFLLILTAFAVISCTREQKSDQAYNDYREYVIEHQNNTEKYLDRQWAEIEQEYNEKQNKAEAKMDSWNDQMRAEYQTLKQNWESFHENHTAELKAREQQKADEILMSSLLPEGINHELTNVTSSNVVEVYKHFVNNVEARKDNLTKEEWTRVENLWDRLDDRKDQVEKDVKAGDEIILAEQKMKYTGIKALNRPVAKTEENVAKEKDK